jgi:hypothetical protein
MRTSRNWIVAAGCVGLALATSSTVQAQERVEAPSYFSERVRAPRDAFELAVTAGYSQGTMAPGETRPETRATKRLPTSASSPSSMPACKDASIWAAHASVAARPWERHADPA